MHCRPHRVTRWALGALALSGALACAGAQMPNKELLATQTAIDKAQESGAHKDVQAARHLQMAQQQLDDATRQIRKGQRDAAQYTLMRANADAELSLAMAQEAAVRTEALRLTEQVKSLRQPTP